jgi:hypothetical protein
MILTPRLERTIGVPSRRKKSGCKVRHSSERTVKDKDVRCSFLNKEEPGLKWLVPGGYIGDPIVF